MRQRILLVLGILFLASCTHLDRQSQQLPQRPNHVVIVFMENKAYTDIIGSPNAPYINSLVEQGASLRSFYAFHHPSQPNYFEFFAGQSTPLGVCDDSCPSELFDVANLGGSALANGISFNGYAEDLPPADGVQSVCTAGLYVRRHCPWTYFSDIPVSMSKDFSAFPTTPAGYATLPQIVMVEPNLPNCMHATGPGSTIPEEVKTGDTWLQQHLDGYVQWAKTNNSLLILTWDEDSSSYSTPSNCPAIDTQPPQNHIATLIVGANVRPGAASTTTYNHHDLLRTILDLYGLEPFGGATTARQIDDIWTTPSSGAGSLPAPSPARAARRSAGPGPSP